MRDVICENVDAQLRSSVSCLQILVQEETHMMLKGSVIGCQDKLQVEMRGEFTILQGGEVKR